MPKYIKSCLYCGEEFVTDNNGRRYCCKTCANRGGEKAIEDYDPTLDWEKTSEEGKWMCPYSMGVACSARKCSTCGWNPEVAEARNQKILEAYG